MDHRTACRIENKMMGYNVHTGTLVYIHVVVVILCVWRKGLGLYVWERQSVYSRTEVYCHIPKSMVFWKKTEVV